LITCPNVKVVMTSRVRLASLPECSEEISLVSELSSLASWQLFKQMTRDIPVYEINSLLEVKPDYQKYPSESNKP
jgi:hypothetical protein